MSAEEILKIYEELIQNPDKLKQGKEILEDLLTRVPQFTTLTCKIITAAELPSPFRKNVCYIIKNVLKDKWMTSPTIQQERKEVKEILLKGMELNISDFKIIEALSLIIAELIKQEGFEGWQPYLLELLKWINTTEIPRIRAGVECLCLIFTKTDYRVSLIVPDLMPIIYQIFNIQELPERLREKVLMLLYLAIETFSSDEKTNPTFVSQCFDNTYQEWMNIFIAVLQTPPKAHLGMKKYILKILTKIFSDLVKYSRGSLETVIQTVWKFMNNTLPLFIWSVVYGVPVEDVQDDMKTAPPTTQAKQTKNENVNEGFELDEDIDLSNEVEAVAVQLVQLMQTLVLKKKLRPLIKVGLYPLINCLCHYMLFSKYQERTWFEDPNEFQAEEEDTKSMVSLRRETLELLQNIIPYFPEAAIQAIMVIGEKFLANMKEEDTYGYLKEVFEKINPAEAQVDTDTLTALIKTSHFQGEHPDHIWKKREIGLLLMGHFSGEIVEYLSEKSSDYNVLTLVEKLAGDLGTNGNAILKGRALWCITQFDSLVVNQGLKPLLALFKLAATSLGDSNLPVRLTAAKALKTFAYNIETEYSKELTEDIKSEYHLNNIEIAFQLFDLLEKCSEDTLHLVLEGIYMFGKINPQHIAKVSETLCTKIVHLFQIFHHDVLNGEQLKDLIKLFCGYGDAYPYFANAFLPYISEIFQFKLNNGGSLSNHINLGASSEEDFFASLFDVLGLLVQSESSNKAQNAIIELLPFVFKFMLLCSDYEIMSHASVCLKAYITQYSQYILQQNLLQDVLNIIYKMLRSDSEELSCIYLGNLINLTFANLLNNSLDTDMLKEVINKLSKAEISSVIQSLVLIYSRLFNINEKEVLDFLCSFSVNGTLGLKVLLDQWLSYQLLFRGKHTRTSTFLALTRIFLAKDPRVENLIVVANPKANLGELYAPFRIMSCLIRGLNKEFENTAALNKNQIPGLTNLVKGLQDQGNDDEDGDEDYEDVDEDAYGGDDDDNMEEDAVKINEEDLIRLKDISTTINLMDMMKEFFLTVAKKDPEYFSFCLKNIPTEDVETLKKYLNF